ncbi:MAG: nucleotide exchange factor GrpE [Aquificaceae bacterium]|nr:nucleotide exchange factor GrpE [Aquificaceae bacterium]MDW8422953.1 nucleotide exchange factor GrpE [Aquificaceae bacterium]
MMEEKRQSETTQEVQEPIDAKDAKIRELEEKLQKLENTARIINQRYVDLQRETEYLKERYRRDLEEAKKYGYEKFAFELLEVVDNFERAFEYEGSDLEGFKKGFELIYRELLRILEKYGIKEIELLGKEFDPYLAEAVDREYSEDVPPNTVIRVERKGYTLHDRVLRPAKVVVSYYQEEIT